MASPKVEQIETPAAIIGEGPHWDHKAQALYYVDILGCTINKYVPATKKHTSIKIGLYHIYFTSEFLKSICSSFVARVSQLKIFHF